MEPNSYNWTRHLSVEQTKSSQLSSLLKSNQPRRRESQVLTRNTTERPRRRLTLRTRKFSILRPSASTSSRHTRSTLRSASGVRRSIRDLKLSGDGTQRRKPGTNGTMADSTIGDPAKMVLPLMAGVGTMDTGIMMVTSTNMKMATGIDSKTANGSFTKKKFQLLQRNQREERYAVHSTK